MQTGETETRPETPNGRALSVRVEFMLVFFPSSSSDRPDSHPGAEDQTTAVLGGPSGMRELECGLLPQRRLVRLVDGTRDRVGGRLAPRLRVGLLFSPSTVHSGTPRTFCHRWADRYH